MLMIQNNNCIISNSIKIKQINCNRFICDNKIKQFINFIDNHYNYSDRNICFY